MKLTGRTMMTSYLSIDDTIKEFKQLGYDGIELAFVDINFKFIPNMTEKFFADHVLECCKKENMPIESLSYHCDYIFDEMRYSTLQSAIKAAPLYGTKIFIISNGGKHWENDQQKDWETFITRTKKLVELAEENDITLAMEFEPGMVCGTTAELHRMFKEVGSPNLMANLDIGHVFLCDSDPIEAVLSLKGKVAHGHIENMLRGVHRHLPPYLGDMDLQSYIDAMKEIGFDGSLGFDLYGFDYIEESRKSIPIIKNMF